MHQSLQVLLGRSGVWPRHDLLVPLIELHVPSSVKIKLLSTPSHDIRNQTVHGDANRPDAVKHCLRPDSLRRASTVPAIFNPGSKLGLDDITV